MSLSPGSRLGPYEIAGPLGAGGMGEVWRARDTRLGREVAIKVLPDDVSHDSKALARFESEARAVAALSHPNILALYDVGNENGVRYAVTELLEGETLREALRRGAFPVRRALEISEQIAKGLAAAHDKGIIHRDVKPENVFLTKGGDAKLLDFGLARQTILPSDPDDTHSPTEPVLSTAGAVVGTVAYMSPEQARGLPIDHRSDQFSLGIVMYEMLAGRRPFHGDSAPETLIAIIREEPEPATKVDPQIPALLWWVVQRCLSKNPEERYSSSRDLAKELQGLRVHLSEAISGRELGPGEASRVGRRGPVWALAIVAVLTAGAGLFVGVRFVRPKHIPAPPVSLALSFQADAAPNTVHHNPFALTPDGNTLVYAGSKLFARRLDRDEIRPIPGTDGAIQPFISPDGFEVGFFAEGKLKKVSLAGGPTTTLCDAPDARGGSWGPDGTIVFTPSTMSGLMRIQASGGKPLAVTTLDPAKVVRQIYPQILPDGEHVLFAVVDARLVSRAAVVSLRTGEQRVVVENAANPRYLPTGHLLFTRPGTLFAVPFSLKRLRTFGPPVPLLDDLVTDFNWMRCAEYAFSQAGTLVYLPTRQLERTLVWVDRKGVVERLPFPPGSYGQVALSPDGGRLAVLTSLKGEREALLICDVARGTLGRSMAEGIFSGLAWAPDGKRVAFGFSPGGGVFSVFLQAADGSTAPERLTGETGVQVEEIPGSLSPDGSLLLLATRDYTDTGRASTGFDISVMSLSGERKVRPFLQTKSIESAARFSPDGRWVVYHSNESGRWEVFVRPYPGPGGKWQISTEGGAFPRWSPSGHELFYIQGEKLMAVDVETKPTFRAGRPRMLIEAGDFLFPYDVAPDGTRFLMIKADPADLSPAQVKVVLNWFEEVKRRVPGAK